MCLQVEIETNNTILEFHGFTTGDGSVCPFLAALLDVNDQYVCFQIQYFCAFIQQSLLAIDSGEGTEHAACMLCVGLVARVLKELHPRVLGFDNAVEILAKVGCTDQVLARSVTSEFNIGFLFQMKFGSRCGSVRLWHGLRSRLCDLLCIRNSKAPFALHFSSFPLREEIFC